MSRTLFCPRCEEEVDVSALLSPTIPAFLPPLPAVVLLDQAGHVCDPVAAMGVAVSALGKPGERA